MVLHNTDYLGIPLDKTKGIFALLDSEGKIIDISQELLTLLSISSNNIEGQLLQHLFQSKRSQQDIFIESLGVVHNLGEPTYLDIEIQTPNNVVTIAFALSKFQSNYDKDSNILVVGYDITKHKDYEVRLLQEQSFVQSFFNNTSEGIFAYDTNAQLIYSNAIASKQFALSNCLNNKNFDLLNFYTFEDHRHLAIDETVYALALQGIEVQEFEQNIRLKDNLPEEFSDLKKIFKPIYLSVSSYIIRNDQHEIDSIVISYKDITKQKNIEKALVNTNQRLVSSRDEDRKHLARELHDGIMQDLMGFNYRLASFESLLNTKTDFHMDANDVENMRSELTKSIQQLRRFIGDLRSVGIEEVDINSALHRYVNLLQRDRLNTPGMPNITLDLVDIGILAATINLCLFRSVQEGVSNIIRHANAQNIIIRLVIDRSQDNPRLILTIEDDGVGFEVPKKLSHFSDNEHFGLMGISERAALVDGEFEIKSLKDKGTALVLSVPYNVVQQPLRSSVAKQDTSHTLN